MGSTEQRRIRLRADELARRPRPARKSPVLPQSSAIIPFIGLLTTFDMGGGYSSVQLSRGIIMDYFEGVVLDYLRADRTLFINSQFCIQVNEAENPDTSGPHWYCDAVALDMRSQTTFLCEISYSNRLEGLLKRLRDWNDNWTQIKAGMKRDAHLPFDWPVRPWLFVPEALVPLLHQRLTIIGGQPGLAFKPRVTPLEMVLPWRYRSWNRPGESAKPDTIPSDYH